MSASVAGTSISALHEILEWSRTRPAWQRDALRRIVVGGGVSESESAEVARLCLAGHNADSGKTPPPTAIPLDATHIPPAPGSADSVSLVSIGELQAVNRIPKNQTLAFGPAPGLTVVFGGNGTGKSGYARVIKKACRTRGVAPTIHPNAYENHPNGPATAKIVCSVASVEHCISWTASVASDDRLAHVFVFDSAAAENYLEEDAPTTFTPSGLDVLPKLSRVCDAVSSIVQVEIDRLKGQITSITAGWEYGEATQVGRLLKTLSAATAADAIAALAGLSSEQQQRLKVLEDALRADPKVKAGEERAAAARVREFLRKANELESALSMAAIDEVRVLAQDARTTRDAAQSFSSKQFDEGYLAKTGGAIWRQLWDAARTYSEAGAYPGQVFPVLSEGAQCVLCQQDLGSVAKERMRGFEQFCKDQTQQLALKAAQKRAAAVVRIDALPDPEVELDRVKVDLAGASPESLPRVREFVQSVQTTLATVKVSLAADSWACPAPLPEGVGTLLGAVAASLDERARVVESAADPLARQKLTDERLELVDRKWLGSVKAQVLDVLGMHQRLALLDRCKRDTATKQITSFSTSLTKALVTDAFCSMFCAELRDLGLATLDVALCEKEGRKGEKQYGLRLTKASGKKVTDVASEGEQRCVALAAFLAELSLASHRSALVFDDPVSSLDHEYGQKTARRLAIEGKKRQVIVFTHDSVFLNDLLEYANQLHIPAQSRYLEWSGGEPGHCSDGLPWDFKSPEDRFDKLDKLQRSITKSWNPLPNEENASEMRQAYSRLRATLERIVERVVFADVVYRFRSYVNFKNLQSAVGFASSECDELQRLFQKCSDITEAHDAAAGKQSRIPSPPELEKDIADTRALVAAIKLRKKTLT